MSQRAHDPRVDVVKGILILVIVAGHNESLSLHFQDLRKFFYYFNVQAFLLLACCFPPRPISSALIVNRGVRYLYPYLLFVLVAALVHGFLVGHNASFIQGLSVLALGLVTGAHAALDQATGLRLFWFLPTLFSLVMIRAVAAKYTLAKPVFAAVGLLILGGVALTDAIDLGAFPLGLGLALAFYPMGVVVEQFLAPRLLPSRQLTPLMWSGMVAFCAAYVIIAATPLDWVAGAGLQGLDWSDPATCMMSLIMPCISLVALFGFAQLLRSSLFLAYCGKQSLLIYLLHMFFYGALLELWKIAGIPFRENLFIGCITLVITLGASLASAVFLSRKRNLRRFILPRDLSDLRRGWM